MQHRILWVFFVCFCLAICHSCKTEQSKQPPVHESQQQMANITKTSSDTLSPNPATATPTTPESVTLAPNKPVPKASPPTTKTDWTELSLLVPEIVLDMRYATTNNFVKQVLYNCPRCFVKPKVAEALLKVQKNLSAKKKGYRLKMYDCYRPSPVQQRLWEIVPDPNYVTPPAKGSMHNRGLAVDITIVDAAGKELDMGTEFDFFGERAHFDFTDLPNEVLENRRLLRSLMEHQGFKGIRTEWWHFSLAIAGSPVAKWEWDCE